MKKILNEWLEHLLSHKPYAELTAEERYFVTETMSEAEYERMRYLVKNAPPVLKNTPSPSPAIKENLLAAMRQMKAEQAPRKPGAIVRLLNARIPAWQVAAAIALLFGIHFLFPEKNNVELAARTEYVYLTDTVYKEVAMPVPPVHIIEKNEPSPVPRINVKPENNPQPSPSAPEILAAGNPNAPSEIGTEVPDTFAIMVSQPRGQSARQTEDLWQFLGEVY